MINGGIEMRILVLTKNIFHELELQRELQVLNHEVFVTRNERNNSLLANCGSVFDCLFLSETLSEKEFLTIVKESSSLFDGQIIRINVEEGQQIPASKEKLDVLYVDRSFVEIRELLDILNTKNDEHLMATSIEEFNRKLSKQEQLFFENLQEGKTISREDMCWLIWGEDESSSRKSQLSNLAKKINRKLDECNYTDKRIKTYWGKGYILQ